jgi:branched-chain amino acid aminotransferase
MEMMKEEYVWFDGEFLSSRDAHVHLKTHTLHYGLGVFEGTRAYKQTAGGSAVFRLEDHVRRLLGSAKVVNLALPFGESEISRATLELVRRNGHRSCYIRHIAFLGAGSMGLFPKDNPVRVAILAWPWGAYLGEEGLRNGIRCKISSYSKQYPNATPLQAKATGNYINSILAKREAILAGYEEAILLDNQGCVAEGSGENLFIFRGGRLETPPLTSVLPGITRDTVMQVASAEGIEVRERYFTRDELYLADEVFLTGTAAEVTPVREIDDRSIGTGRAGALTLHLQEKFFQIVRGELSEWKHLLSPVLTEEPAVEPAGAGSQVSDPFSAG